MMRTQLGHRCLAAAIFGLLWSIGVCAAAEPIVFEGRLVLTGQHGKPPRRLSVGTVKQGRIVELGRIDLGVPEVARIMIKPKVSPAAGNISKPTYFCLVRASDNVEIGAHRPAYPGKTVSVYVAAGTYRIMILGEQQYAAFIGRVEVKAGKTVEVTSPVTQWKYFHCDKKGRVTILNRPPVEKHDQ